MEKESVKVEEAPLVIEKIEFRNQDRWEKKINTQTYKVTRPVTKGYFERQKIKPFGIGTSFEDLKTNAAISTVQRENVWISAFEHNFEELDFKEKMIAAAEEKKLANMGGAAISDLQKQLQAHDEGVKI